MSPGSAKPTPVVGVRIAQARDIPGLQRLFDEGDAHHAAILPEVFRPVQKARPDSLLESWIDGPGSDILVADRGGVIVGVLVVQERARSDYPMLIPRKFAFIDSMVVAEGARGEGIGTRLLEEAGSWARYRKLETIQLSVWTENPGAVRLYERLGFRAVMHTMEMDLG